MTMTLCSAHSLQVDDCCFEWSMDHPCGPGPWTLSWLWSMDYPCGPPLILYTQYVLPAEKSLDERDK